MQHLQPNTTLQGGKYKIERVLGQGGFGITYLATLISSNRQVAIKELFIGGSGQAINDRRGNQVVVTNSANQQSFNQQKAKFKKEALRLANLNHPNLVKVHEFFEENGTDYYVMDYIEGESLRTKLNREGVLSESLVLKYLQQLLPALETAHKQNIWHLDIKPENIMVDRYGHVYLIDFGASKHVEPNSTLTTSLALAYTPGYCPPELLDLSNETPEYYLKAIKDIGPWTDIYALGATMYNLLTDGIPPSKRRLDKEGRKAFMFQKNISSSTQDLIIWMMKPNREDRLKNLNEILEYFGNKSSVNEEKTIAPKEHPDKIVNFVLIKDPELYESEVTIGMNHKGLLSYFDIDKITWDYSPVDNNLISDGFVKYLNSQYGLFVDDISKKTKSPIGTILIHIGWLMKEGKLDLMWYCNSRHSETRIDFNLLESSVESVLNSLSTNVAKSIYQFCTQSNVSIEGTLISIGWLLKEGKLYFENNLIKLA